MNPILTFDFLSVFWSPQTPKGNCCLFSCLMLTYVHLLVDNSVCCLVLDRYCAVGLYDFLFEIKSLETMLRRAAIVNQNIKVAGTEENCSPEIIVCGLITMSGPFHIVNIKITTADLIQ